MTLMITIGDHRLMAELDDTPIGRDFASLLPLTVAIRDFHATEKIADLPRRLDTAGSPAGTSARAGDITYFSPWGNLALFYADFGFSDGLVRIGHIDDPGNLLGTLPDDTSLTFERVS